MVTRKWKVRSDTELQQAKTLYSVFLSNPKLLHSGSQMDTDKRPRADLVSCPSTLTKSDRTCSKGDSNSFKRNILENYILSEAWKYHVAFPALLYVPWPVFAFLLFLAWSHLSLSKQKLKTHNCQWICIQIEIKMSLLSKGEWNFLRDSHHQITAHSI